MINKDIKTLFLSGITLAALCFSQLATAKVITLKHVKITGDPKQVLVLDILKLALSKSDSANEYRFEETSQFATQERLVSWLDEGVVDVIWAGTGKKYEQDLRPIRIPIYKGMLGHRIFIIRKGDQEKFNHVDSLADLRQIPLGQGRFWGDTIVLKNAEMNVVDPVKYDSLFHMLEGGRFDFFPRAIHEPWTEVESYKELNLTVEKNILLVYPFAMYFFVNKNNNELAQKIEQGFRAAIDDGSFDELFYNNPEIKATLEKSDLQNRTVFRLPNPDMSDETPIEDKSLWLNLDDLHS
ncbi:hypothetical protein TDB9533_00441 [Thalassocella blandensis]|nr:hypothetical protein TDB9533_00441 [Thalassocella blandensis]